MISGNSVPDENCAKTERCHVTEMEKKGNATTCSVRIIKISINSIVYQKVIPPGIIVLIAIVLN